MRMIQLPLGREIDIDHREELVVLAVVVVKLGGGPQINQRV